MWSMRKGTPQSLIVFYHFFLSFVVFELVPFLKTPENVFAFSGVCLPNIH